MSSRFQRLTALFDEALTLEPERREAFAVRSCGDDRELLAELREMLAAHLDEASLPGAVRPADPLGDAATSDSDATAGEPREIGPYRLVRVLGEGGMGTVWLADQETPVRRRVALKLIKLGMSSREVVARFESERQALAVLDHPCIARVIDAGLAPDGRPYFVMEYVDGVTITEYCEQHQLSLRQILALFIDVCRAVQHAHYKGIIHRDLKPSNILVTDFGDGPVPRIIDFGIAKAVDQRLTEESVHTAMDMVIGTPEYMSPEQADPATVDIDSRTDVYSLGVLLYELLVGRRPFDSLHKLGLLELLRVLREEDPPRPSARLGRLDPQTSTSLAAQRHVTVPILVRELDRDLDWIVLKAMEKDRTRRYTTASELAADVERYLADQPLEAGPPSAGYRVRKFIRRHRSGVALAGVAAVVLVVVAVLMSIQSFRLSQALERAERERTTSQRIAGFLAGLFEVADPGEDAANRLTAREVLDRGVKRIDDELADEPAIQSSLLDVMGKVYGNLSLAPESQRLFERSLALKSSLYADDSVEIAQTLSWLGVAQLRGGKLEQARENLTQSVAVLEAADNVEPRDLANALWNLGSIMAVRGEYEAAEQIQRRALELHRQGGPHRDQALILSNLGSIQARLGKLEEAKRTFTEALDLLQTRYPNFTSGYAGLRLNLGYVELGLGHPEEAEQIFEQELARLRDLYGAQHETIANLLINLGATRDRLGKVREAEEAFVEGAKMTEAVKGPHHPDTLRAFNNLALFYIYKDREPESIPWLERTLGATGDAEAPALQLLRARALQLRGFVASLAGDLGTGERWLRGGLELRRATPPEDSFDVQRYSLLLGDNLRRQRRFEDAEALLIPALEALHDAGKEEWPSLPMVLELYRDWGRPEELARYQELQKQDQAAKQAAPN